MLCLVKYLPVKRILVHCALENYCYYNCPRFVINAGGDFPKKRAELSRVFQLLSFDAIFVEIGVLEPTALMSQSYMINK